MDNINPNRDNYQALKEEDNSKLTTQNKYIGTEKKTTVVAPLNKNICIRTIFNSINSINIDTIFNENNIESANKLIQQLHDPSKNILSKMQIFLQLHRLAKQEYRKLFIEQWREGCYKLILLGHCELLSPPDLAQKNFSVEELSQKIFNLLLLYKNESNNVNKPDIEQKLIILIMLIEKRIIDGETSYYPKNYQISLRDISAILGDTTPKHNYTSNILNTRKKDVKLMLSKGEDGILEGYFPNYQFIKANNFTGRTLEIDCEIDHRLLKKVSINIDKLKVLDHHMFHTLFLQGYLLFVMINKNHKLAFNYLLNSEYFVHNLNNNLSRVDEEIDMIYLVSKNQGFYLLSQACCKGVEYVSQLLNKGAELSAYIILEAINNHKLVNFPITESDQIIFNSILFMLQNADKSTLDTIKNFMFRRKFSYIFGIINKSPSLLDYILKYYSSEQQEKVLTFIFQKLISFNDYSNEMILYILKKIYEHKELRSLIIGIIDDTLIVEWLSSLNNIIIKSNDLFTDETIELLINVLYIKLDIPESQLANSLYDNNNIIIQLVFLGIKSTDKSIADSAKKLYKKYLSLENIQKLLQNDSFNILFGDLEGNPIWDEKDYQQAHNYILISKTGAVMLLADEVLEKFLDTENNYSFIDWKQFFLFDIEGNNQSSYQCNLKELFTKHFELFAENFYNYASSSKKLIFTDFIRSLSLEKQHENLLISGLNTVTKQQSKSIDDDDKLYQKLLAHINIINNVDEINHVNECDGITEINLNTIKKIFKLENKTNNEVAKYLICIASLFIKFSSQSVFGTSYSSPVSVRFYAYALLQQAYKLDKKSFFDDSKDEIERYKDWTDRLMGMKFSCSDVLFAIMQEYIKKNYNYEIKSIIPIYWL